MKRLFTLSMAVPFLLWAAGCEKMDASEKTPIIEIDKSELFFDFDHTGAANAQDAIVKLTDAQDFKVDITYETDDKDWLKVGKSKATQSDGSLKHHVATFELLSPNTAIDKERTALVTFTSGLAQPVSLKVRHGFRGQLFLSLSQDALDFKYDQTNEPIAIKVATNASSLTATVQKDADWLEAKADLSARTVTVNLTRVNKTDAGRSAVVTIEADDQTARITVNQASFVQTDFKLTPSTQKLTMAAAGDDLTASFFVTSAILPIDYRLDEAANAWVEKIDFELQPAQTGLPGEKRTAKITVKAKENDSKTVTHTGLLILTTSYTDPVTQESHDQRAEIDLVQEPKPTIEIEGEWQWTAISAKLNDDRSLWGDPAAPFLTDEQKAGGNYYTVRDSWVENAQNVSGTAVIKAIPGGFSIAGIRGVNLNYTAIDPAINLSLKNGKFYVGGVTKTYSELNANAQGGKDNLAKPFDVAWITGTDNRAFEGAFFNGQQLSYVYHRETHHNAIPPKKNPDYPDSNDQEYIHMGAPEWTEHLQMLEKVYDRLGGSEYPVTFTTANGTQTLSFPTLGYRTMDYPDDGGKKMRTYNITYIYYIATLPNNGAFGFVIDMTGLEYMRNIVLTRPIPAAN